jgi:DNA polymerase-3 subunit delta
MLYVIYGSDSLARREVFDRLKAELDKDGSLATNYVTFDAKQTSPQEVMAACDTMPFLGDRRLVVVEALLQLGARVKRGRKRTAKAKVVDADDDAPDDGGPWVALAEYVPRMPETTTLVLIDDEVSASNGLLMAIGPLGKVEHCTLPNDKALPQWVTSRAKTIGLKLDARAASTLAELIGPDPLMLSSELEKLLAYSGGEVVREADVRELVSRAKEHKFWDLTDAVLDGQGAKAARVLHELLEDGVNPAPLLAAIATRYRRIAIAHDMLNRGENGSAIAQRLGMKMGFGLDKLIDHAQRPPPSAVRAAYARLIQAELDLKRGTTGGLMDDRLALELAVQELAAAPVVAAR